MFKMQVHSSGLLPVHKCTMVFKAILIINTTDSNGHVRMHVCVYALGVQRVNKINKWEVETHAIPLEYTFSL